MIAHTTATFGGKIAKALGIGLTQVVIAPPEQIFGRLKEKGLTEKLPALAIDRKGLKINRENVIRSVASRKGFEFTNQPEEGEIKFLHCLPIRVAYDVGVFSAERDSLDKAEANLLWFLEESGGDIDVTVEMSGIQFNLPIQIAPEVLTSDFDIERSEEWEKAKFYRMNFSLECITFLLRSSLKPTILNVEFKIVEQNGITLVEQDYGRS